MKGLAHHTHHSYRNNFDMLRLIFAALVMLSHGHAICALTYDSFLFEQAEIAVHGFFIISGFVISWSIDRSFEWKSYATKRFSRIYPLYAVVITTQLLVLLAFNVKDNSFNEALHYVAANAVTLNFLKPAFGTLTDAINGSLWTIKIEIMFYMAMPLYLWCFKRVGITWVVVTFIAAFTYRYIIDMDIRFARQLPGAMTYFILGMVGYFYGKTVEAWVRSYPVIIGMMVLLFGCLVYAAIPYSIYPWKLYNALTLAVIIYILAFYAPHINIKRDISYGVYLWHMPVFIVLSHVFSGNIPATLLFISSIICALCLAWMSAIAIEQPCVALGKVFARRISLHNIKSNTS